MSARPTLRAGIRALPAPVWILCAGSFVNRFGSFVAVFLLTTLAGLTGEMYRPPHRRCSPI